MGMLMAHIYPLANQSFACQCRIGSLLAVSLNDQQARASMKRFLLFAGTDLAMAHGVAGFVADFDSSAEALVLLVDQQKPSEWWHILDTQTGEVIARRQVRLSNGTIGFQRS